MKMVPSTPMPPSLPAKKPPMSEVLTALAAATSSSKFVGTATFAASSSEGR